MLTHPPHYKTLMQYPTRSVRKQIRLQTLGWRLLVCAAVLAALFAGGSFFF